MGEENLRSLLDDLLETDAPLLHTHRSMAALVGEISSFEQLSKLGAQSFKKLIEWGDWAADDMTISVKTITDLDSNHPLIEDAFIGLCDLMECPTIRMVDHFRVYKASHLDDEFVSKILEFMHFELEALLKHLACDFAHPRWASSETDLFFIPEIAGASAKGRFRVKANRYDPEKILVEFSELRKNSDRDHKLTLDIEIRKDGKGYVSTSNEHATWWAMTEIEIEKLGPQIKNRLDSIAKKNAGRDTSQFAAWITVETHPKFQKRLALAPEQFKSQLDEYIPHTEYPVVIHFQGGFELAEPLLLNYGPELKFAPSEHEQQLDEEEGWLRSHILSAVKRIRQLVGRVGR